jgi:hypothetical protein
MGSRTELVTCWLSEVSSGKSSPLMVATWLAQGKVGFVRVCEPVG